MRGMRKNLTQRRGVNRGFAEKLTDEDGEPKSHGKIARKRNIRQVII
jgi:hypothetical protein